MSGIPGCETCATPFTTLQVWVAHLLRNHKLIMDMMKTKYAWHICETLHFIGMSLLVGSIGVFDMRVLGMARGIPVASLHRLKPWGIAGFAVSLLTGILFLMTYPYQYIFQWPFVFKVVFILLAGLNALAFDSLVMRKIEFLRPGDDAPVTAKIMCAASLCLWIGVIFAGRFLAFYRPIYNLPPP